MGEPSAPAGALPERFEERLRFFFDAIPDAVLVVGEGGRIVWANAACEALFGYDREGLRGRPVEDLLPERLREAHRAHRQRYGRAPKPRPMGVGLDLWARRQDGTELPVEVSLGPWETPQGRFTLAVVRRLLPAREAERKLRAYLEHTRDLVFTLDRRGRLAWANKATRELFGLTVGELVGKDPLEFVVPEDRGEAARALARVLAGEPVDRFRVRVRPPCGRTVVLELRGRIIRDDRGRVVETFHIARDVTAQVRLEEELQREVESAKRRLRRLRALYEVDMAILGATEGRVSLGVALDRVRDELEADASNLFEWDAAGGALRLRVVRGFRVPDPGLEGLEGRRRLALGEGFAGRVASDGATLVVPDVEAALEQGGIAATPEVERFVREEGFRAYVGVPLTARGELRGVLGMFFRRPFTPDPEWLEFAETMAGQIAIALDHAGTLEDLRRANRELERAYDATLEGWVRALDLRDQGTEGHTQRVTELTLKLARRLGVSEGELVHLRRGALLHDIGKMAIPDRILLKPGKLTDEEWALMKRHPVYAYEWLKHIEFLRPALEIPYSHHERWDGTGYPRGLKGEAIPLAARIFAVVDAWDAMTSDRPYRKALSREQAVEELKRGAGTQFDPRIVEAFLQMLQEEGLAPPAEPAG